MFYDLLKILKKCLKFWYVFVITLIVGLAASCIKSKPIINYSSSFDIKSEYLSRKVLWDEFYSWDVYNEIKKNVLSTVSTNYSNENMSELKNKLNLTSTSSTFSLNISPSDNNSSLFVSVQSKDADVCKKVINYVYEDIGAYLEETIDKMVEEKYKIETVNTFSNISTTVLESNNRRLVVGVIITIFVLFGELFIIGFSAIHKKTIESEGDLISDFGVKLLINNYDKNTIALQTLLRNNKSFQQNVLVLTDDEQFVPNIIKNKSIKYRQLKMSLNIDDFYDINETAFIVEIIKGKTLKKDIGKLLDTFKLLNYNDVCFITREEIKKDEDSSGE